ncbi:MAG: acyl-CoA thiolase, partial [Steroidobacteraceae bacterium]
MSDAYLYDAVRSARGKARADGGLAQLKPQQLVSALVDGLQERGNDARNVQALVLGCVGQVGDQGANIALVAKLYAGVADDAYAFTLNNY